MVGVGDVPVLFKWVFICEELFLFQTVAEALREANLAAYAGKPINF